MKVLVTGGLGYIGSHTVVELLNSNYEVVVIDNLSNSNLDVLAKIKLIAQKDFKFYQGNVQDKELLEKLFQENKIDSVIHFAGYKAVGESVLKPLMYYQNNLDSTLVLLETMQKYKVNKLVFSSSATVYGNPKKLPIPEDSKIQTTNPYGTTKAMIETILKDLTISNDNLSIVILRYFNPLGAHKSSLLGENPKVPNNIMPYIIKVATKEYPYLHIFGNDYDTKDGTGVRDYIHVCDLALGHIKALEYLQNNKGIEYFNLGAGKSYSVLELIKIFEKVTKTKIPYKIEKRRPGDIPICYADVTKAKELLNFKAEHTIEEMCQDSYNYIIQNKKNYQ